MRLKGTTWFALLLLAGCGAGGTAEDSFLDVERVDVEVRQDLLTRSSTLAEEVSVKLPPMEKNDAWRTPLRDFGHHPGRPSVYRDFRDSFLWRRNAGAGGGSFAQIVASPVIAGARVFTMDARGRVVARDIKNSAVLWAYQSPNVDREAVATGGGLVIEGRILYVSTGSGLLTALESTTGKLYWRRDLKVPIVSAPSISHNTVTVVTAHGTVVAFDLLTAQEKWRFDGFFSSKELVGNIMPAVAPTGAFIVLFSTGNLVALSEDNGLVLWSSAVPQAPASASLLPINGSVHPVIYKDLVIVASSSSNISAFSLTTGNLVWQIPVTVSQPFWVAGDYLFAVADTYQIFAANAATGEVYWAQSLPHVTKTKNRSDLPIFWTGPYLVGTWLWAVNSDRDLYAFSPETGLVKWRGFADLPYSTVPSIAAEHIFWLSDNAVLSVW